jgi:BlaI family penicillinase repressor
VLERISEAEPTVMLMLWDQSPLTAQDVIDRVSPERGWSANTVKTLLSRLVMQKAVAHETDGRSHLYRPLSRTRTMSRATRAT